MLILLSGAQLRQGRGASPSRPAPHRVTGRPLGGGSDSDGEHMPDYAALGLEHPTMLPLCHRVVPFRTKRFSAVTEARHPGISRSPFPLATHTHRPHRDAGCRRPRSGQLRHHWHRPVQRPRRPRSVGPALGRTWRPTHRQSLPSRRRSRSQSDGPTHRRLTTPRCTRACRRVRSFG